MCGLNIVPYVEHSMQYHEKKMVRDIGDNFDSLKMTTIFQQVTINQFTTKNQVRLLLVRKTFKTKYYSNCY